MPTISVTLSAIRQAIQTWLKAQLKLVSDVGELYYQGDDGTYPVVRHSIVSYTPDQQCGATINVTIYAWTEDPSSANLLAIMDEIVAAMNGRVIVQGSTRIQTIVLRGVTSPMRQDRLWRSDATFQAYAT